MTSSPKGRTIEQVSEEKIVSLFSNDQARRLTGLSERQLHYWDQTGFFSPAMAGEPGERFARAYSFEDLVGLRTIALMRKRLALQELRRVGAWLHGHRGSWAGRRFWIRGKRVFWNDEEGTRIGTRGAGQTEMPIEMDAVTEDMREAVARLQVRTPDTLGKIERRRYTVGNSPIIAGTRIPTNAIWQLHAAGYDSQAIQQEFPRLTERDIDAALEWEQNRRAS
jgi:uncharacterized protein (DUF433 family)